MEESLMDEGLRDKSFRNESLKEESLKNESLRDENLRDESLADERPGDEGWKGEAVKGGNTEALMSHGLQPGTLREMTAQALGLQEVDVRTYSPLVLAYIGDAVYELIIRTRVISRGSMQVSKMHKKSASLVKAETQANLIKVLSEELTEEEQAVYKRGRNAKSVTTAKHATVIDYRMATGFEALVGYLYLTDQTERLLALVHDGLEKIGELS